MQKITGKIVATMLLCFMLTMPIISNINVHGQEPATLRVDPPEQEIPDEPFFDVFVWVDSFFDVYMDGIILTYDTSIIDAVDVEAVPPFSTTNKIIDDANGYMQIESVAEPPIHGSIPLAHFTFRCTGGGISDLTIAQYYLFDPYLNPIPVNKIINGRVTQTSWYFKPPYPDYAPSGVPDFDQKQWGTQMWINPFPPVGTWSYCGPVAIANSLWWLDSEHEPNPIPPPIINDNFPLVQSYAPGVWDDHDPQNVPPFVEDLAFLMDTNGQRFGHQHCGTEVHEMTMGLNEYISRQGLDWKFYVHLQKAPGFLWIGEEIKKCQDVVLLLGFWQFNPYIQQWVRVGGHYVTCAGVDSANWKLAISDPYIDATEMGLSQGRVLPPPPHPHTGIPETLHNDALYVSHDFYPIGPSPSPGGPFGFYDYPAEYIIDNFGSCQNTPDEFLEFDGEYLPGEQLFTEIEYAVVTSCKTGIVAAGSEDTNLYVWDFFGALQWQQQLGKPVISVAMDNNGTFVAAGTRTSSGVGDLWLFDALGNLQWVKSNLNVSTSYNGGWAGTESKSVDVKYNAYSGLVVVAAATDQGLYLFDQNGNQIWQFYHQISETLVRISQDGNYIICLGNIDGQVHYFSHMRN
ncbi:MAG: cohesin domain-containing protein [Candidatus Bathyarchaeia archaeon]